MKRISLILFLLLSLNLSCTKEKSEKIISIKVLNKDTNQPIKYANIAVVQITKPMLAMQGEKKIIDGNTNKLGEFSFTINKSKSYYIYIYENSNTFLKDYMRTIIGGIGFEASEIFNKNSIDIYCSIKNNNSD